MLNEPHKPACPPTVGKPAGRFFFSTLRRTLPAFKCVLCMSMQIVLYIAASLLNALSFRVRAFLTQPAKSTAVWVGKNQSKRLNFGGPVLPPRPKFAASGQRLIRGFRFRMFLWTLSFKRKCQKRTTCTAAVRRGGATSLTPIPHRRDRSRSPNGYVPLRLLICCLFFLFASFSCTDSPSASDNVKVTLTFEDASCIETWLRLKIEGAAPPYSVALSRDGNTLSTLHILSSDTLLIDEGLAPSTTYTYRASLTFDNNIVVRSPDAQARTLDTTSHNWVFDPPVLLGDGSSSVLYDVVIINDTLAYAVGEIYKQDSLGNWDPNAYNLVKWDGTSWELKRIPFIGPCSAVLYPPLRAIWAFSENEILVTNGGSIVRYDGVNASMDCRMNSLLLGAINKIWASGPQDVYAVGNVGTIVRYDGTSWTRVESGTDVRLTDIWGTNDWSELWACGFNDTNGASVVLRLVNGVWQTVWDRLAPPQPPYIYTSYLSSLWSSGSGEYVVVGGRFYRNSLLNINIVRNEYIPTAIGYTIFQLGNFAYRVRGSERNDVFLVGDEAMIWHWNGATWLRYDGLINTDDRLYGLAVSSNTVVAVGTRYNGIFRNGLVIRGRR